MSNKKTRKTDDELLEEEFDFSRGIRGAIVTSSGIKLPVTIRLDGDVIDFFKDLAEKTGGKAKYQTLINEALKEYIAGANIEKLLLSDEFVDQLSDRIQKKIK
ncbi:MAG: BrnA antitoxin family protein [Oligoflexus sp.]